DAGTAACNQIASLPALCPDFGCSTAIRPPRKSSSVVPCGSLAPSVLAFFDDDMADPSVGEDVAGLREIIAVDEHPARQSPDRAFEHAHIRIGDHEGDAVLIKQRADEGDQHRVV